MIFEALFLAFALGSEKAQQNAAARQVERWRNDIELQRNEFFMKRKRWQEDKFTLFGEVGSISAAKWEVLEVNRLGHSLQWHAALEKLAILEEGYFPYTTVIRQRTSTSEKTIKLNQYELEKCHYKIEENSMIDNKPCSFGYLALSDVENYINFRKNIGGFCFPCIYEQIPQEIRSMFYSGKVTIGIPYGQEGITPCQIMTIQEARDFMSNTMEERFQKHWAYMHR